MPSTPTSKKCNFLGCREDKVFGTSWCQTHGGKRSDKYKQNERLYNLPVWDKIKRRVMTTQPLCVSCMTAGKVVQAEAVDHVFPHRQNDQRFLVNVFQPLCIPCHTQKTRLEQLGIFRRYTDDSWIDYGEQHYSEVIDSDSLSNFYIA
jgi:5-methylcytosine-specific restriction protein A